MVKSFITLASGVNVTKLFVSVNVASTYLAKLFTNDLAYFGFDDKVLWHRNRRDKMFLIICFFEKGPQ
jgi:hypothetical protein